MKTYLAFAVLTAAVATGGCATSADPGFYGGKDSGHPSSGDALVQDDSSTPSTDSSTPPDDTATDDTGTAPDDTSIPPDDTGTAPIDTGTAPDDTGSTAVDTGSVVDTGTVVDTGPVSTGHVGETCSVDTDCIGGSGLSKTGYCTKDVYYAGPIDPTSVCLQYDTCTPDSTTSVMCDGSRGICLDDGTGTGECVPACKFSTSGTYSITCAGKNACSLEYFYDDGTGNAAYGRCFGGCSTDSDCPSGSKCDPSDKSCYSTCASDSDCTSKWAGAPTTWKCDTARGACTFKYPKALGATCTSTSDCRCMMGTSATSGYCVTSCITGSTSCGTGFTCDALLPSATFTAQPAGVLGVCAKNCTSAADCPSGQTCTTSAGLTQKTCRP